MVDLDHLLFAAHDLTEASDALQRIARLEMQPGGRHDGYGTHNALAGLDRGRYLEAIALDPTQAGGSFADAVARVSTPRLMAWCARCDDPHALHSRLREMGHAVESATMARTTPEGVVLSWTLIVAHDHPFGGAAPFFIDWGSTPHPTTRLDRRATLTAFTVRHPRAADLEAWWSDLDGVRGDDGPHFEEHDRPALAATFEGPASSWRLEGAPVAISLGGDGG